MSDELANARTEPGTVAAVERRTRGGCFGAATALALAAGTLPGDARAAAADHLESCDDCRALVAEVALSSTTADDAGYRFGAELARGGMGRVLVARDLELDREVAIKQLLADSPSLRARFEREVRITAALQHPGIVPVYRAGALRNGEPFYAMRRIHGRSFDAAIALATTTAQRLALLPRFLTAAEAMAYAHSQRVIHRDLKPHNILIGDFGEVVVVDWGLAKRLDHDDDDAVAPAPADAPDAPGLTRVGTILGTVAYMSPEQALGEPADLRSDVYALGAVLYHVLAGAAPHAGSSVTLTLVDITEGRIKPLATRAPEVPPDLSAIVARAMSRSPADRYQDAAGLVHDLQTFLVGKLVAAHAYTPGQLLRRWLRRHRTAVIATTALVLGLGLIAAISFRRVRAERDRAEAQRAASESLVGFVLDDLGPKVAAIDQVPLLQGVNEEVVRYYRALSPSGLGADNLSRWSRAAAYLSDVMVVRGDLAHAREHLEEARLRLEQAAATGLFPIETRSRLSLLHYQLGDLAHDQGRLDEARREYEQALEIQRPVPVLEPTQVAGIFRGLGTVAADMGQPEAAIPWYARSRAILLALPEPGRWARRQLLTALSAEGSAHFALGHLADARAAFEDLIARATAAVAAAPEDGDLVLELARARALLATVAMEEGDHEGALAEHQHVVEQLAGLVARDPSNANWRTTLADALGAVALVAYDLDRYGVMRDANARERALWTELATSNPSDAYSQAALARAEHRLGLIELVDERAAPAAKAFARAAALARPQTAANASVAAELCEHLDALAEAERGRRDYPAALAAIDEGMMVARRWKGQSPAPTWFTWEVTLLRSRAATGEAMGDRAQRWAALDEARAVAALAPAGAISDADRAAIDAELAELERTR